jgi:hypothetical protein
MTALEDEETQKRGMVVVVMRAGQNMGIGNFNFPLWRVRKLRSGLPLRLAGMHLCNDDEDAFATWTSLMLAALESHTRARFRSHRGM